MVFFWVNDDMFPSPLLLLLETLLVRTVLSPVICLLFLFRAFWLWSFFWFFLLLLLWLFARERRVVDLLSKAFLKTASFWPAHFVCIVLDALLMDMLVMMRGILGFSTGTYRCFLLRTVFMFLSPSPLFLSPLCVGYIFSRLYKVSVLVMFNVSLLCTCFCPQQGWIFPVLGSLLTSSGYGLLIGHFCYVTCRGFPVLSVTLLWCSRHRVWSTEFEVTAHSYTKDSVVFFCGFHSRHVYAFP